MAGKTVSAVTQAIATRVKDANRNTKFSKALESRKNTEILDYLNTGNDEEQKRRDFQVSFFCVSDLFPTLMKISAIISRPHFMYLCLSSLIAKLSGSQIKS